jgi:hypothetical protein
MAGGDAAVGTHDGGTQGCAGFFAILHGDLSGSGGGEGQGRSDGQKCDQSAGLLYGAIVGGFHVAISLPG